MRNRNILLVEDKPKDELLILRALKKSGITSEITVIRDGAEALDYLFATGDYSARNLFDLPLVILLDIKLPKVSGLEVLQRIRSDSRICLVPVVMLSSSDDETDIVSSYKRGVNSYVIKPVTHTKFEQTLSQIAIYWLTVNKPPAYPQNIPTDTA